MGKFSPNGAQLEAINSIDGPLLISAGPGTGKTATLVNRYANMVNEHGINPENILMATFTEKAAKEIITRISYVIPDFDLNDVYIGTFHSICLRIVKDNIAFIPNLKKNFVLMDDFDQKYFLYQRFNYDFCRLPHFSCLDFGNRGIWEKSSILADWLNGIAEEQVSVDELLNSDSLRYVALGEAKQLYDELLESQNRLDFATIQATAYTLLSSNDNVCRHYQSLFKYMMIDEYQDTNSIQERLIFLLSNTNNICVVGDDDQAMYRFRGATIKNILDFKNKFEPGKCREVKLTVNYRSAPEIVDFYNKWMTDYANDFFAWNGFRIDKTIVPCDGKMKKEKTSPVLSLAGDSVDEWCNKVYCFLVSLKDEGKIINYNQVAFLFRSVTNEKAKLLANYLEEKGIPVYSPRSKMFFERYEIKAAIGLLLHLFSDFEEDLLEDDNSWFEEMVNYYNDCLDIAYELMDQDSMLESWVSYRMNELSNLKGNTDYAFTRLLYQMFTFDFFREIIDTDLSSGVADQRAIRNLAILTNILSKFESIERVEVITSDRKVHVLQKLFRTYFRFLMKGGMDEYQDESEYAPSGCVEEYLRKKGYSYDNKNVAKWLSDEKINIEGIEAADARPLFLLWKQALSTGWDCPRAKILVKLRDNMSDSFEIQTIGRIRRMPEAKHYNNDVLDNCYMYTFDEEWKEKALKDPSAFETRKVFIKEAGKELILTREVRDSSSNIFGEREVREILSAYFVEKYKLKAGSRLSIEDKEENRRKMEADSWSFGTEISRIYLKGKFVKVSDILTADETKKGITTREVSTHDNGRDVMHIINGFVVKKGSVISSKQTKSCPEYVTKKREQYNDQIDADFKLLEDILFNTPSGAAAFVCGSSANGNVEWKTTDGITLKELESKTDE